MAAHDLKSTVGVPPHEMGVSCARRPRVSTTGVRRVRSYSLASPAGSCVGRAGEHSEPAVSRANARRRRIVYGQKLELSSRQLVAPHGWGTRLGVCRHLPLARGRGKA
jgi:hypothetical protein